MIEKNIEQIELKDIEDLLNNAVEEWKTLDYKEKYILEKDPEKWEFLWDICSFLNTSGGYLIFWIKEEKWIGVQMCPFPVSDTDAEKLKIENIIRDGISLRASVEMKFLKLDDGYILILKMVKSWKWPHRVSFTGYAKTKDQFFARNSAWRYQMDVTELKNAFVLWETLTEKIRDFRMQRVSEITSNNTPVPIYNTGKIILHLIPVDAFSPWISTNLNNATLNWWEKTRPMYASGWSRRINLEWVLVYSWRINDKHDSYLQVYRNGIIESVDSGILEYSEGDEKIIPSALYEKEIIFAIKRYLWFLQENQINTPIFVFLTLVGIKGYKMWAGHNIRYSDEYNKVDKDVINLPDFLIQNYDEDVTNILRPMFDLIWNACGFQKSYNFDNEWKWIDQ